jgi:hypothetical protein
MITTRENLTEQRLAEEFDKIQREVADQIRKLDTTYPELSPPSSGEEVVRQPVYTYEIHAVS